MNKKKNKKIDPEKVFTWKIGGAAGQGQQSAGLIFSKACSRGGAYTFHYSEFPSLIRGGHVTSTVSVSNTRITAMYRGINMLVALNEETIAMHAKNVVSGGRVLFDSTKIDPEKVAKYKVRSHAIPVNEILEKEKLKPLVANIIALGASFGMLEFDFSVLKSAITHIFKRKGEAVVKMNFQAAQAGYEYVAKNCEPEKYPFKLVAEKNAKAKYVLTSNDAVALSAVASGCRLYVHYPMSPSSSILHSLAAWSHKTGMAVHQPEDEIAGVHNMIGAMYAGTRSMISTSGGGFALMAEGLTLSAITETPAVICVCSRGGPATGLPTWTEQGDLKFLVNAGHGDFPRVILAPSNPQEAFHYTSLAFNLAEKLQIPVFILMDKYLSEGYQSFDSFDTKAEIDRGKTVTEAQLKSRKKEYQRYEITKDGISPRSYPGTEGGVHLANSDEHDEYGYAVEAWHEPMRVRMVDKRNRKIGGIFTKLPKPRLYGPKKARITLLGWGSTSGPVLEVLKQLPYVNYLHVPCVWPVDGKAIKKLLVGVHKLVAIENNSDAQFTVILRGQTSITPNEILLKYDGKQFFPEELVEKLKRMV